MGRTRLTIQFGPAFSGDLWGWKVSLAEATGGRVEVVWEISAFEPSAKREHRFRARTTPDWWHELSGALAHVQFGVLPPSKNWTIIVDDAPTLAVDFQQDDLVSGFSISYAPELWPALPKQTRDALQQVVAILDPIARDLHRS